jgi:hypothetical protein
MLASDERSLQAVLVRFGRAVSALTAEVLVLRHQLNLLQRKGPKRVTFSNVDRLVFTGLYRLGPGVLDALKIVKPRR